MKYTYILNDSSVIVLDTSTGEQIKFFSTDTRYQAAIDLIKNNNFADIFKLDTKTVINKFLEQQDRITVWLSRLSTAWVRLFCVILTWKSICTLPSLRVLSR